MTLQEYENKIILAALNMDSLIAVLNLVDENYFQRGFDRMGEQYWIASYKDLESVLRATLTLAGSMRETLAELCRARVDTEEEAQA